MNNKTAHIRDVFILEAEVNKLQELKDVKLLAVTGGRDRPKRAPQVKKGSENTYKDLIDTPH